MFTARYELKLIRACTLNSALEGSKFLLTFDILHFHRVEKLVKGCEMQGSSLRRI